MGARGTTARGDPSVPRRYPGVIPGGGRRRTAGGGDEADADGAALARQLDGHGVGEADLGAPIAAADRHEVALGGVDAAEDGERHLLRRLHAEAHVPVVVADGDRADEARALARRRLLLDRGDLHHLVLELVLHEEVDDLVLLDREREEVDLLERLDLARLDEEAELGARHPLLLVAAAPAALAAAAPPRLKQQAVENNAARRPSRKAAMLQAQRGAAKACGADRRRGDAACSK